MTGLDLPMCATCAMQYDAPRDECPICTDERQWVPAAGQRWTTLRELIGGERSAEIKEEAHGITGIGCLPSFAIGQRALVVPAASGNVLWDCVPFLDEEVVEAVRGLGGISAVAISHPHYYSTMVEWARTFDVPVYLHESDQEWIGRRDEHVQLWSGQTHQLSEDLTLVNLGVHFAGGTVMHWNAGAGALFSGDIVQVVPDQGWVSFMYSYPNLIPERPRIVRRAVDLLEPYDFETIYGAWWGRVVQQDGKGVVRRSAKRYLDAVRDD